MIAIPLAVHVDRVARSDDLALAREADLLSRVVEAALALVIIPAILTVAVLVGTALTAEWLVRGAGETIRRSIYRLGRVIQSGR